MFLILKKYPCLFRVELLNATWRESTLKNGDSQLHSKETFVYLKKKKNCIKRFFKIRFSHPVIEPAKIRKKYRTFMASIGSVNHKDQISITNMVN